MSITRYSVARMELCPVGEESVEVILWDDMVSLVRTMLDNRKVVYADGETEDLCSDWCVDRALSGLLDQLGEPDLDAQPSSH